DVYKRQPLFNPPLILKDSNGQQPEKRFHTKTSVWRYGYTATWRVFWEPESQQKAQGDACA
ncbi:hypothetical protein ACRQF6_04300, partial [Actinotignum sp. GS-2025f]|uniref:hypothetical protein n=1 Tax=Actinotignum sp. GS-2025f TaxID=3427279 RepID=UPI003F483847